SLEAAEEGVGVVGLGLGFGRDERRYIYAGVVARVERLGAARAVTIAEVRAVAFVELIVAFDRVLNLAILGGLDRAEIAVDEDRRDSRPVRPVQVERKVIEGCAVDLEGLDAKCVREPQAVGRQIGDA